jgi:hypothetical protein
METQTSKSVRLAQSASAIGAAILGVGIGAEWGTPLKSFAILILLIGAIIHTYGMYVTQMKNTTERTSVVAKILWISAWLCFVALIAMFVYLLFQQK